MKHFVSVDQLKHSDIFSIFDRAKNFKVNGLNRKYDGDWVLMFLEPSTRTRMSFEKALKGLGFNVYMFNPEGSSLKKGETLKDTVITLKAQGFEGVVIRTSENGIFQNLEDLDIYLINAGDGTNEHPTQALIDAYTLWELYGDIQGMKILYVGDIAFSRVFRSGYKLFKKLGCEIGVCAPRSLKPTDIETFEVSDFSDLDSALEWCDIAIFLRIQKERQEKPLITSERDYLNSFGLTSRRAEYLRKAGKFYMHPGPVNRDVEIAGSEIYGANSLIINQITNGVFIRAAVVDFLKEEGKRKLVIER